MRNELRRELLTMSKETLVEFVIALQTQLEEEE